MSTPTLAAVQTPVASPITLSSVVRTASAPWLAAAFMARVPVAMLPLGMLLFGRELTGSFAQAGLMVAGLSVGGALGAPLVGALIDRFGPRKLVVAYTGLATVALSVLILLAFVPTSLAMKIAVATVLGLTDAQVGAISRSQWSWRFASDEFGARKIEAALGYETVADEVSFVAGPILAATIASLVSPTAALTVALAIMVVARLAFAALTLTPTATGSASSSPRTGLSPALALWVCLAFLVGSVFGSVQTGIAATLADGPAEAWTGAIYAGVGVGSAIAGSLTAKLYRWSLSARVMTAGLVLALGGLALASVGHPVLIAASCLLVGTSAAPLLVSAYTAAERMAQAGNTFVLTLLATATVSGVGLGAGMAGTVIEAASVDLALLIPAVLGLVAVALGLGARRTGV